MDTITGGLVINEKKRKRRRREGRETRVCGICRSEAPKMQRENAASNTSIAAIFEQPDREEKVVDDLNNSINRAVVQ